MKRVSVRSVMFAAACAATIAACVSDPDLDSTDDAIIGGVPVKSAKMDAIGALGFDLGDGTFIPFCSGTLIAPTVVLTAEHCVNWGPDPAQVRFLVGWNAYAPKQALPVRGFAWEQTIEGGQIGLGADVAVMHLEAPATGVTPLAYGAIDETTVGRRYVGVGYGLQDALGTDGTRMAGSMTLQGIGGKVFEHAFGSFEGFLEEAAPVLFPGVDLTDPAVIAELQAFYDSYTLLDVEAWFGAGHGDAQACFGDSGGPITLSRAGKTTVTGVTSWGFAPGALCEWGGAYATLNPVTVDFIEYEKACPLIPREGTCADLTTVLRCATPEEGGYRPLSTDCGELGLICGIDETGELGCVDDPCEGIPAEGVCDGTVATRCSTPEEGARRVVSMDCAELGLTCGIDEGTVACVDEDGEVPADCPHEVCETGPALDAECGECTANVCAADPYCCETFWDDICVAEVETYCGTACPGAEEPTSASFTQRGLR